MPILDKYNKVGFTASIPEGTPYVKLSELFEEKNPDRIFQVKGFYINTKGKFGEAPVIHIENLLVNAPSHLVPTIKAMREDEELIQLVNEGKVGFKIEPYTNSYGNAYSLKWVNI